MNFEKPPSDSESAPRKLNFPKTKKLFLGLKFLTLWSTVLTTEKYRTKNETSLQMLSIFSVFLVEIKKRKKKVATLIRRLCTVAGRLPFTVEYSLLLPAWMHMLYLPQARIKKIYILKKNELKSTGTDLLHINFTDIQIIIVLKPAETFSQTSKIFKFKISMVQIFFTVSNHYSNQYGYILTKEK